METLDWQKRASCRDHDPDIWFTDEETAKTICADCPVQQQCGEFALKIGAQHGIWAGAKPRTLEARMYRVGLKPRRKPLPPISNHGTRSGEQQHRKRGEKPCEECAAAKAAEQRAVRARKRERAHQ